MNQPKPDINRLLELQRLLLNFQAIDRTIYMPADLKHRPENDVEHSYALAMTAWFLSAWFPDFDQTQLFRLALAHDLVEVYAGDTYIFDKAKLQDKIEREKLALERLGKEWTDFPELTEALAHYMAQDTPEAIFVRALDKIMPMMLNCLSQGYSWKKLGLHIEQLHANKSKSTASSPAVHDYYLQIYKIMREHPEFFPPANL